MRIFISAGEPSGDIHAAELVHALKKRLPEAEFLGFGGEHLESAGVRLLYPLVELAVMWFGRVLLNLHKFIRLANQAEAVFRDDPPDALIIVDYPGFHWALAKRAKRHGVPVYYYVPPQLWAWAGWRVEKVRKWVDLLLCSLPFEPDWYRQRGIEGAIDIGHPFFDDDAHRVIDDAFVADRRAESGRLVAILPGSRTQELTRNLPMMLRAAVQLAETHPDVRFAVACLNHRHLQLAEELVAKSGLDRSRIALHAGKTRELIRSAELAWSVSGSVSLELLVEAVPTVILYALRPIELKIARRFMKAKSITLVNLLADRELMPEYLTDGDAAPDLDRWAALWLDNPARRAEASQSLADLRARVARPGAPDRAADAILAALGSRPPHRRSHHRGPHSRRPDRTDNARTIGEAGGNAGSLTKEV